MTSFSEYLCRGVPLYHMCDVQNFEEMTKENGYYFPPTYSQDGFIHATSNPKLLVDCGNHFYKNVKGNWVCILLNPGLLGGPVIYEAPAPVGNTEAAKYNSLVKFPHIYGGIPKKAVLKFYPINRAEDGSFLSIDELC